MEIIYIALLTIVASSVGTMTGFGTSTIMVPVLSIFLPVPVTLILVGIIHWFGDIWKMVLFKSGLNWKIVLAFGIPGIITSYLGASMAINAPKEHLPKILGVFIVLYILFIFLKPKFKLAQQNRNALIGGTLSGFFAGVFGIGGAVRGLFLSAFDLPKSVYIFTAGVIAFCIDTTRILTYISGEIYLSRDVMWGFLLFIPASFLGAKIGKFLVNKIPQDRFRLFVSIFLFLVGLKLLF